MTIKNWRDKTRVVVCGVNNGRLTADGTSVQHFKNLVEARKVFPDLDPDNKTARFTHATGDPDKGEMKFESHQAHDYYNY